MNHIPVIQGSPSWYTLRKGIPTASEFGRIITPVRCEYAKGADTYAAELIAEAIGEVSDFQGTPDTERGLALEGEARQWLVAFGGYGAIRDGGFCLADRYGASPDGLLVEDGTPVEIKCPAWRTLIKWKIAGGLPDDHKAQVHGEMLTTGADRCLFIAYSDNEQLDPLFVEVRRDAFTAKMADCLEQFCDRLHALQDAHLVDADAVRAALATGRADAIAKIAADRAELLAQPRKNPTMSTIMSDANRGVMPV